MSWLMLGCDKNFFPGAFSSRSLNSICGKLCPEHGSIVLKYCFLFQNTLGMAGKKTMLKKRMSTRVMIINREKETKQVIISHIEILSTSPPSDREASISFGQP